MKLLPSKIYIKGLSVETNDKLNMISTRLPIDIYESIKVLLDDLKGAAKKNAVAKDILNKMEKIGDDVDMVMINASENDILKKSEMMANIFFHSGLYFDKYTSKERELIKQKCHESGIPIIDLRNIKSINKKLKSEKFWVKRLTKAILRNKEHLYLYLNLIGRDRASVVSTHASNVLRGKRSPSNYAWDA